MSMAAIAEFLDIWEATAGITLRDLPGRIVWR
jgi:hypothetical protein